MKCSLLAGFGFSLILLSGAAWAQSSFSIAPGGVQNDASQISPSLPNGSVAPGGLFLVYVTTSLGVPFSNATSYPLTTSFNNVSMTVTVNGIITPVLMFATFPLPSLQDTLVEGVLPSSTPTGTGMITVSYNGQTTAPSSITVVPNSFGFYANNSQGFGTGAFTDSLSFSRIGPTNAAHPGELITGWGTGIGAGSAQNDANGGTLAINPPGLTLWVGGQALTPGSGVSFTGRSTAAAEDQINFTIPSGVTGCAVPVVLQIGSVVSNTVTIPVAASGSVCSDPLSYSASQLQTLSSSGSLAIGQVSLSRTITSYSGFNGTTDMGTAVFSKIPSSPLLTLFNSISFPSVGSCVVVPPQGTGSAVAVASTPLDAGPISVAGPAGTQQLAEPVVGSYSTILSDTGAYLNAGTYTVTGKGGADVGAFTAELTLPPALAWTNQSSLSSISRSQGLTVTWTGGDPNGYAEISGSSSIGTPSLTVSFYCTAPNSALTFTVPPSVLLALPPTPSKAQTPAETAGTLSVGGAATSVSFPVTIGLEYGSVGASIFNLTHVTYQ
jgi:uncharacterized protein (TIGR03437 family)